MSEQSSAFMSTVEADPEMADAFAEAAVLVDLLRENKVQEAVERIEGWSADYKDAACLFLGLAAADAVAKKMSA